jgi:hypothetical protein
MVISVLLRSYRLETGLCAMWTEHEDSDRRQTNHFRRYRSRRTDLSGLQYIKSDCHQRRTGRAVPSAE